MKRNYSIRAVRSLHGIRAESSLHGIRAESSLHSIRAVRSLHGIRAESLLHSIRAVCSLHSIRAVLDETRRVRFVPFYVWAGLFVILLFALLPVKKVYAAPVRVVIDPGHGGTEEGAKYGIYTEKHINLAVAKAMAEELGKYEGIEVFLTRTEDVDMSLQERADYAKSVGADFLFCIHFNASDDHNLYGSEVWCSAFGNYYTKGRVFGEMCLDELCSLGIYRRGVKMRLSEKEEDVDYYGIIRHCVENDVTACIIEHCHIDNKEDEQYFNTSEGMKKLGILDATAVAKYYGLSSKELNVNYKNYQRPDIDQLPKMDATEPEASLTCLRVKKENREAELLLTGEDKESGILYYAYSMDGGKTYSSLQRWDENSDMIELMLKLPGDEDVDLKYRVYNGYDLYTETETVHIPALDGKSEKSSDSENVADAAETVAGMPEGNTGDIKDDIEDNIEDSIKEMAGVSAGDPNTEDSMTDSASPPDSAHVIDMSWYADEDAEDSGKISFTQGDFSKIMWFLLLGLLIALLAVLIPIRIIAGKRQKKARYKGRKR